LESNQYSQIYFNITIVYSIQALTLNQEEKIKQQKIRVSIKQTINFHTVKVRIIIRANLKYESPKWYET